MKYVEPNVFLIGKPDIDWYNVDQWFKEMGVNGHVSRHAFTSDAEKLVELAGRRCYMSFELGLNPNVTKIRDDIEKYLDNILASGHGSVLEHTTFTFAIENVSRVFTAEMNRHRAGMAISEGSLRYIRFTDIKFWIPFSIQNNPDEGDDLILKRQKTREIFDRAILQAEENYRELEEIWKDELSETSTFTEKKKLTSCFRRIVPMGVATGGIWSGNIRALRHIFTMRCAPEAEEEIKYVATLLLEVMMMECSILFKDFKRDETLHYRPKYRKV